MRSLFTLAVCISAVSCIGSDQRDETLDEPTAFQRINEADQLLFCPDGYVHHYAAGVVTAGTYVVLDTTWRLDFTVSQMSAWFDAEGRLHTLGAPRPAEHLWESIVVAEVTAATCR